MKKLLQKRYYIPFIALVLIAGIILSAILPFQVKIGGDKGFVSLSLNTAKAADNVMSVGIKNNVPTFTISKWNGESTIDLGIQWTGLTTLSSNTAESTDYKISYAQTATNTKYNENGGFDINLTLKTKPVTNRIVFSYNPKLVDAYYQPPLSSEWKIGDTVGLTKKGDKRIITSANDTEVRDQNGDLMASRPNYVVNSIVFYSSTKSGDYSIAGGVNYKDGKIGNLYRMMDSEGSWANWSIETGQLVLTVDQKTIDNGKYPITINPTGDTFGFSSTGASVASDAGDAYYTCIFPCPTTGTASKISATVNGTTTDDANFSAAVYASNGSAVITNGGGAFSLENLTAGTPHQFDRTITATLAVTNYALIAYCNWDGYTGYGGICYDSGTANQSSDVAATITDWSAAKTVANANLKYSIWVTYTSSGNASISNTPSSKDFGVVNPSSTYWAKGTDPLLLAGSTNTNSPTTNTSSAWTTPVRAYADDSVTTNITSGNPSGSDTWGNYGYSIASYATISQVRVRYDAWSLGYVPTAPSQVNTSDNQTSGTIQLVKGRIPTGDGDTTGTWAASTGTKWSCIDEAPSLGVAASSTDYASCTAAGYYLSTYTAFNTPSTATIVDVKVFWYGRNSGTCAAAAYLKVGTSYYNSSSNLTLTTTYAWDSGGAKIWTTNPTTGSAWTYDQVNGTSANTSQRLNQFGTNVFTAGTYVRVGACYIQVDYTDATHDYANVDETSVDNTDGVTIYSAAGTGQYYLGNSSNFSIPTGSTITNLTVYYNGCDQDPLTGTNNLRAAVTVNGTRYVTTDAGASIPALATAYSYAFTVNPSSNVTWTVADINGSGSLPLQQFGVSSSDSNPTVQVNMIYAVVNYTEYNDQIKVDVSWDGGSNWSATQNTTLTNAEATYWYDVSGVTSWTPAKLVNGQLKVRALAQTVNNAEVVRLDWLPVEVTVANKPLTDGQSTFDVTNNGTIAVDISYSSTNFTGGGGWTLGAPGATQARLTVYVSGNVTGTILTNSNQQVIMNLAASANKYWDLKLETPTSAFIDGTTRTATMTLTAVAH